MSVRVRARHKPIAVYIGIFARRYAYVWRNTRQCSGMPGKFKRQRLIISKQELRRLYLHEKLTITQIADQLSSSPNTIRRRLIKFGIDRRDGNSHAPSLLLHDANWLRKAYITDGKTKQQIADEVGAAYGTVDKWLRRHAIPIRPRKSFYKGKRVPRELVEQALRKRGAWPVAEYNMAVLYPELAAQWHPTLNGALRPDSVTPKSAKRVYWQCSAGHPEHVWDTPVHSRVNSGSGCPFCAGRNACSDNNLEVLRPDIAAEWHPTNNQPLGPGDVTVGSGIRVSWQCKRSEKHQWRASVAQRTGGLDRYKRGTGCPDCARGRSSLIELELYCELKALFPDSRSHYREFGPEIDIWLPKLKIGIEVDGSYWHKDKVQADRRKTALISKRGAILIRLRERPLRPLEAHDVQFDAAEDGFVIVCRVLRAIEASVPMP